MKTVTSNPSTAWGPAEKTQNYGEIFYKGWYLVQRIAEKLRINSVERVGSYL